MLLGADIHWDARMHDTPETSASPSGCDMSDR